ncbi:MAG: hypothetical protein LDL41_16205 [Coleofasciculus sp. S288]|nr:hypothetical protein [Coleofasciculus sp. S288]
MSNLKAAYKEIALAVWQLCSEEHPDDLAEQKPVHRAKAKDKKRQEENSAQVQ